MGQNNIYAYSLRALWTTVGPLEGHENWFVGNKVFMTSYDIGHLKCDGVGRTVLHDNEYYTANGTVFECGMPLAEWQAAGPQNDARSVSATIPDADTIIGWAKAKLGMQ